MNNLYKPVLIIFYFLALTIPSFSQEDTASVAADRIENYKEQVKRLLGFFEFSLNTLGDPETPTREKEIIINESFLKAFRDEEVMIEDDLDENREMVTHKSVQAYLKDVDFFFQKVEFDIKTQEILPQFNDLGELYFKVTATRNLQGITIEGDSVNNDHLRYFELNLDESEEILKIVSIYTTKLDEREELISWWKELPMTWKEILGSESYVYDTLTLSKVDSFTDSVLVFMHDTTRIIEIDTFLVFGTDSLHIQETDTVASVVYDTIPLSSDLIFNLLRKIIDTRSLDISENLNIRDLKPVRKLDNLESLDISNTLIDDLFPLRNLIKLEMLSAGGTAISDIGPLVYSTRLRSLDISKTRVRDIAPVSNMRELESLDISGTPADSLHPLSGLLTLRDLRLENTYVTDLLPIAELINLELINCSGTSILSLEPLQFLTKLERIYIEGAPVEDLSDLEKLENLRSIYADGSKVKSLEGLEDLASLQYIYCDETPIDASEAQRFMTANKNVLVVYESETLGKWWNQMDYTWKEVFRDYITLDTVPTKEQLHEITLIEEINISGNVSIANLEPLYKLTSLITLDFNNTDISSLEPLRDLIDLENIYGDYSGISDLSSLSGLLNLKELSFNHTGITTLEPLDGLTNLKLVKLDNTGISDIYPLAVNHGLEIIYCDGTNIEQQNVDRLRSQVPECLVIFQTSSLKAWWGSLNDTWKQVFLDALEIEEKPAREQLQQIANLRKINIDNKTGIDYLDALNKLPDLEELSFAGAQITDISSLIENKRLKVLNLSNNPIYDIRALASLSELTELDFSNTPVNELDPVAGLVKLQYLKFSGTEVKKLDPISGLRLLKVLEFYNTPVKKLDPLYGLKNLKNVKCYNTRISGKRVDEFKSINPGCEVIFY